MERFSAQKSRDPIYRVCCVPLQTSAGEIFNSHHCARWDDVPQKMTPTPFPLLEGMQGRYNVSLTIHLANFQRLDIIHIHWVYDRFRKVHIFRMLKRHIEKS
jgi:hypothetical protein